MVFFLNFFLFPSLLYDCVVVLHCEVIINSHPETSKEMNIVKQASHAPKLSIDFRRESYLSDIPAVTAQHSAANCLNLALFAGRSRAQRVVSEVSS